jgi:UDP:flavonoid glycosyltransferase YjiC (YdhE family)
LRAGAPTVAVPFHTDQTFWGARVAALGAGPPPVPFSRLTADRLADAIRAAVTGANYRCKARGIAAQLAAEDGAAGLLAALERLRH